MKKISIILILAMTMSMVGCGNELIEINIPAEFDEDFGVLDLEAIEKEAEKVETNADGSKLLIFTKSKHREIIRDIERAMLDFFKALEDEEETPYLKKIKYNEDYSEIQLMVDREKGYIKDEGVTSLIVGMYCSIYRVYNGDDPNIKIKYIDLNTNQILESMDFPDVE